MEHPQPYASTSGAAISVYPLHPTPMAVVGPHYCCPYPVELAIVRKVMTLADKFTVTDSNGNVVFKLQASLLSLRDRRVLLDAAQNPVITLRRKIMTLHDKWKAFRGDSTDPKDLLFTLKRSSLIQLRTKLDVFLASNTTEQACDFKIKGSWLERSCVVYARESNTIVAQMHKKHTFQSIVFGKTNFMVTVYPNVDYAFIVALVAILDEINQDQSGG
ncbi:protein LURP-one-related 10-like [Prosopis cineraria]|uniref:protein LURP-one-related 10-like n=1 Tax=Prosopis cineraria TaxID=364024 RepID=UPI002410B512|nr:protein LURP-one-related 10-like [Prosopis cineraria]XP_054794798.1 protein LURP-one-related 10-like [Prosopis cineraria]